MEVAMTPSNTQVSQALSRLLAATERVEREIAAKILKRHVNVLLQDDVPVVDTNAIMGKLSDRERRFVREDHVVAVLRAITR